MWARCWSGAWLCPPHLDSRSRPPISRSNCGGGDGGGGKPADARLRNVAVVEGALRVLGVVAQRIVDILISPQAATGR